MDKRKDEQKTMEQKVARINELYHKSQEVGLTDEERQEQARLRQDYIFSIRKNLNETLSHVSILNQDGTVTELTKKNQQ